METVVECTRGPVIVWGLGYIGLTTTLALLRSGAHVIGVDTDAARIAQISEGPIKFHRSIEDLHVDFRPFVSSGQFVLACRVEPKSQGTDATRLHFVAVPTEVTGKPHDGALRQVLGGIRTTWPDACVVIESTVAPNWLSRSYFDQLNFCLAPRRDWFHSAEHNVRNLTRVVAASNAYAERVAIEVLGVISSNTVVSTNLEAVAFTKAYENSLWLLMTSYTNYLAQEFSDLDIREVLRLAKTNWRTPFDLYPAFNVGGALVHK